MAYALTTCAPGASNLTAKNRVWGIFANPSRTRPENRRQPQQPRRKNRPTATKPASGIPYWPSRDPIGEKGGVNLCGFVENDGVNKLDFLGLKKNPQTHKVGKCEIYIYYGHHLNGHKWEFEDVACGLQSFIGCFPDKNNCSDPGLIATGTPVHEHPMAVMNGENEAAINDAVEQNLATGYEDANADGITNHPSLQGAMPYALDEVTSPKSIASSVNRLCNCTCSCTNVKVTLEIQNDNKILDGLKHSKRWKGKFKNKGLNVLFVTNYFGCAGPEASYQLDLGTFD